MSEREPVFRLVTPRGLTAGAGSKLYAFGQQILLLENLEVTVSGISNDDFIRTKIVMTLLGNQVLSEVAPDEPPSEKDVPWFA